MYILVRGFSYSRLHSCAKNIGGTLCNNLLLIQEAGFFNMTMKNDIVKLVVFNLLISDNEDCSMHVH